MCKFNFHQLDFDTTNHGYLSCEIKDAEPKCRHFNALLFFDECYFPRGLMQRHNVVYKQRKHEWSDFYFIDLQFI